MLTCPHDTQRIATNQYKTYRTAINQAATICIGMANEAPHDRLVRARKLADFKYGSDFSKAYDIVESTYRSAENGNRPLTMETAKEYAGYLQKHLPWVTWLWLLEGVLNAATLIGYVGGGEAVIPLDDDDRTETIDAPPSMHECLALVVRGRSMVPVYSPGDTIFFAPGPVTGEAIIGRDCLVQLEDGRRLVKNIRKSRRAGHYALHSYGQGIEPEDAKLIAAAPVKWVKRA